MVDKMLILRKIAFRTPEALMRTMPKSTFFPSISQDRHRPGHISDFIKRRITCHR